MSWPCSCPSTSAPGTFTSTVPTAWDYGIMWRSLRIEHPTDPALGLAETRDQFLRVVNGTVEDNEIESMIAGATEDAEEWTQRALMPQTWQMILSAFPSGDIVLERPPLIDVTGFEYVDSDGTTQQIAVSPPDFQIIPSGKYRKARLRPTVNASWPTAITGQDSVTITYRAGYSNSQDPQLEWIRRGIRVHVGELYKQRSLTVVGTSIVPAPMDAMRFYRKVYG